MKNTSNISPNLSQSSVFKKLLSPVTIREGHDNFFTPLRLLMATLVMVGHAYVIALKNISAEPSVFLDYGFSYLAVNIFFIASGFLVTKSMAYRGDISDYSSARLLRIYPALIVHVLFVILIIGTLSTTLPLLEYLSHYDVWKQPFLVLTFINTDVILPGVFSANHEQYGSAPLWTLRYELLAYISTAVAFALGLLRRKWMVLAQFVIPSIIWIATHQLGVFDEMISTARDALRFSIAYGLGAAIYAYRDRISFNVLGLICCVGLTVLFKNTSSVEVLTNLSLGYGLMLLAYANIPRLNGLQKLSDVSYGVYIYHWCLLQAVFQFAPQLSPLALLAIVAPITFGLAYASWHWVEKPMLQSKSKFATWLRFGTHPKPVNTRKLLLD